MTTPGCSSCGEDVAADCAESKRPCGHHCNCSWEQDVCHWCGRTFGEATAVKDCGVQVEALRVEPTRPLTKEQRTALALLQDMRRRYPEETWDGITCSGYTWPQLGTTWPAYINWRTARSLQRLGLVTTEYVGPDEGSTITLTAVGVEA